MMKTQGVYAIHCGPTGKRYIGSSRDCAGRWCFHRRGLQRGRHHNCHLQRAWEKHGAAAFSFCVLEVVSDAALLLLREQHHLDQTVLKFNLAERAGCGASKRRPWTAEHRVRMSAIRRAQPHPRGRVMSSEEREMRSAVLSGRSLSTAHRANISRALTGRHIKGEWVAAWRASIGPQPIPPPPRVIRVETTRACEWCEKAFVPRWRRPANNPQRFCSNSCSSHCRMADHDLRTAIKARLNATCVRGTRGRWKTRAA